jgi:hypothetical protein
MSPIAAASRIARSVSPQLDFLQTSTEAHALIPRQRLGVHIFGHTLDFGVVEAGALDDWRFG